MRQLSTGGLAFVIVLAVAFSSQGQSLSAQQIIDRSMAVYANCISYVDEGEVKTLFLESDRKRTVIKPFTTAFVRPSDFRFEYKERRGEEEWDSYIVWKDAESVKTWWSIRPGVESPETLSRALAGATGVSSGSANTIPTLLMPEMKMGSSIKSLSGLKLVGEEEVNGSKAYKIEGTDLRNRSVTLWLDEASFLIVKTFRTASFPKFETETTTTYKPQVNVSADGKLAFNPPSVTATKRY